MQVVKKQLSETSVKLTVTAEPDEIDKAKAKVLSVMARSAKIAGFRPGKAPLQLVERQADQSVLQNDFLSEAVNSLYSSAIDNEKLRPVAEPQVNITKFVPFTTLEFTVDVDVLGEVTLPDYKKIKAVLPKATVTAKDVDDVLETLRTRAAEKKDVSRPAKDGDQVWIDFTGVDTKTKLAVNGADGKDYPLMLGSNTFIPGFETNLIGLKAGEDKTFTLTFPKDYGVNALKNRQVDFNVVVNKVQELIRPKADDAFASQVGPFKTLADLKTDIKKQLEEEKGREAKRQYENALIEKIADKSTVAIPESLIEEEVDRAEQQERQNLNYRGQTWQEHLLEEGVTEAQHRERLRESAEKRVKAGLVLSEIASAEKISVSPEELNSYMDALKQQYPDEKMQEELKKPDSRREILSRIVSEKTIAKLTDYATS